MVELFESNIDNPSSTLIIDFEDSFTFNIYSILSELGQQATVVSIFKIKEFIDYKSFFKNFSHIILGPGPGHPSDYERYKDIFNYLFCQKDIRILGICLGHQIFAHYYLNFKVKKSLIPMHGRSIKIPLLKVNSYWVKKLNLLENKIKSSYLVVQRYNSLAVMASINNLKKLDVKGVRYLEFGMEILMFNKNNIITYQFHPESVGTIYQENFFRPFYSI